MYSPLSSSWSVLPQRMSSNRTHSRVVKMNKDLWWIVSGASSGQPRTEVFRSGSSSFSVGPEPPGDTDLAEACVVKVGEGKVRNRVSPERKLQ